MRVAVIDVGSNTVRLLVADVRRDGSVTEVARERAYLSLGAEIVQRGTLDRDALARVASVTEEYVAVTASFDADRVGVIVTAPGRQGACSHALVNVLEIATGWPVRVLAADEEGRLAYEGAIARAESSLPEVVAVVDVGGGSTEIVVGTPLLGAAWVESLDVGSLRLSRTSLPSDPPTAREVTEARSAIRREFSDVKPPRPDLALAAGGSARAIAKVVGPTYGVEELDEVVEAFCRRPAVKAASGFGIHASRAGTVLAGALLLSETSRALGRPFELARGGLREGAALALAREPAAAAA